MISPLSTRGNSLTLGESGLWSNGIIPLPMRAITNQIERRKFLVSHLETCWIDVAIPERGDRQSFVRPGLSNQFQDDLQRGGGWARQLMEMKEKSRCSI